MKHVLGFLRPYKRHLIVGPFFKLLEAIFELFLPFLMKDLIDKGISRGDSGYIIRIGLIMLAVCAIGMGCSIICQYLASRASQGYGTDMRNALFAHINSLSYAEVDALGTPTLINRITNDVNVLQQGVAMLIRLVVRAPFICIGSLVMMVLLDAKLAVVLAIAAPVLAVMLYLIMSRSLPLFKQVQDKLDRVARVLRENLSGVRVIRAFARQKAETDRFGRINAEHADTAQRALQIASLANPMTLLIMNLAILAILWVGGQRVNTGSISSGTLVAFINYIMELISTLVVIADLTVLFTRASASAQRVEEVFNTENSLPEPRLPVNPNQTPQNKREDHPIIAFQNVSFAYAHAGADALSDVSFSLNKGQTLGVFGGTGSGKSTLINLIPRFYDVTRGVVLLAGTDVREMAKEDLRARIAIVPQKSVLFSGTVAENLRWGNETASDEQIWAALEAAQGLFVRDKGGLDAEVARGGMNFSGGQRQRLCIARALIKRGDILILDDATSALDFATDAALRRALRQYARDLTAIVVSQRISAVMNSDTILVLDDGALIDQGSHQELVGRCGIYRETVNIQLKETEVKEV